MKQQMGKYKKERNNEKGKNIKGKLERIKEWLFCQ